MLVVKKGILPPKWSPERRPGWRNIFRVIKVLKSEDGVYPHEPLPMFYGVLGIIEGLFKILELHPCEGRITLEILSGECTFQGNVTCFGTDSETELLQATILQIEILCAVITGLYPAHIEFHFDQDMVWET